jgi:hypothetical protein
MAIVEYSVANNKWRLYASPTEVCGFSYFWNLHSFKQDTSEIPMAVIVAAGKMLCRTVVETYEEGFGHTQKSENRYLHFFEQLKANHYSVT